MEIALKKELAQKIGYKKLSAFKITDDTFDWKDKWLLDMNNYSLKDIKHLQTLLDGYKDIRGTKRMIRDINLWIKIRTMAKDVRVKRFKHFDSLLIEYLRKLKKHWIFSKSETDLDVFLAYYVSNVVYHPPERSRDYYRPAYVSMSCVYEKFGTREQKNFTFYAGDVIGKKISEILMSKYCFIPESDELNSDYDKELVRYKDLIPKIGHQFTVHSIASDDTPDKEDKWRTIHQFSFADDRRKNRVVIDAFLDEEGKEEDDDREAEIDTSFWSRKNPKNDDDDDDELDDDDNDDDISNLDSSELQTKIPVHPNLVAFDLFRHLRMSIHVNYLKEYVYDDKLADKLILPKEIKSLVTMLVEQKEGNFKDIVAGKGGGAIVLLTGKPGVGKTLTAEVFAESDKKPLYSVQASQLGTDPDELEKELMTVLQRAARWNAIMLLDEADVYVHERGNDLIQNAIVGVFLRVLEYHSSILFLTTNRPDLVDDAIASRCVARIDYKIPSKTDQKKIWKVLAEVSDIKIKEVEYKKFADKHRDITGRDVKNLLKLSILISSSQKKPITCELLEYVLKFKPTSDVEYEK